MLISKNRHVKEMTKLSDRHLKEITKLSDQIESLQNKHLNDLDNLSGKLKKMSDGIMKVEKNKNKLITALKKDKSDSVIANVANFLIDGEYKKDAFYISKCRFGGIKLRVYDGSFMRSTHVDIEILVTGSFVKYYGISRTTKNEERMLNIEKAFKLFFSKNYVVKNHEKLGYTGIQTIGKTIRLRDKFIYKFNYSMRHIDPKDSDFQKFVQGVDKLKTAINSKNV